MSIKSRWNVNKHSIDSKQTRRPRVNSVSSPKIAVMVCDRHHSVCTCCVCAEVFGHGVAKGQTGGGDEGPLSIRLAARQSTLLCAVGVVSLARSVHCRDACSLQPPA